jgi:hypothetical protein
MGGSSHPKWAPLTMRISIDKCNLAAMKKEDAMKRFRSTLALAALISCFLLVSVPAFADSITITIPGTSDLWLAGMPAGSGASGLTPGAPPVDFAPFQSPVWAPLSIIPSNLLTFTNVTGLVNNGPTQAFYGPDGNPDPLLGLRNHFQGAQNGISDLVAPHNALIGVFLGNGQPDLNVPPAGLDFSTQAAQNYLLLSPTLQQTFFVGNGLTSDGQQQQIIVPEGATRLFLGTMDGWEWNNNGGSFTLTLDSNPAPVPEPGSILLLGVGLGGCAIAYRRKNNRAPIQS